MEEKRLGSFIGLILAGMLTLSFLMVTRASGRVRAIGTTSSWQIEAVDAGKFFRTTGPRKLALDAEGHPHIAYGETHLFYAYYDGTQWHREVVDREEEVGEGASLALDAEGHPHISYRDHAYFDLKYAYYDGSEWYIETVDSGVGEATSIALDTNGYPHIGYYDLAGELLKYAYYDGSEWHIETIVGTFGVEDFVSLALDGNGYPHIGYYDGIVNHLKYAYYDGSQWHVETVDGEDDVGTYLSLALDAQGHPHISYYDAANCDLKYAYHDGTKWHIETVDSDYTVGFYTSLALDAEGRPHISYSAEASRTALKYAYYDGSRWHIEWVERGRDVLSSGQYPSLALDANGNPHVLYEDDGFHFLKYATYDRGQWHTEIVDRKYLTGFYSSLSLDASGYPHIAYLGLESRTLAGEGDLKYAYYDGNRWHLTTVESDILEGSWNIEDMEGSGKRISLALDMHGYPHIGYVNWSSHSLKYAHYDGSQWHIETVVASGTEGSDYQISLALDANGYPHIAYHYNYDHDLKYAYYDGSEWHFEIVDTEADPLANVGLYPSLALDANGYPYISYFDECYDGGGCLKYAHYDGSQWHVEVVDAGGELHKVGMHTSLALDTSGLPHISYLDEQTGLKYAHYDGSQWHIENVSDGGWYTSLALDADGHPHISYYDNINDDLKYAYYDGSQWHIETVDSTDAVGKYTSLTLDAKGYPHISYYNNSTGSLNYARQVSSVPATPTPTPSANAFSDVPDSYWAVGFINRLYNAGITGGCAINPLRYCPDNPVTRAQMAVFLEKGMHYPSAYSPPDVEPTFPDTAGHWAEDWIEALRSDGITSGFPDGTYRPESPVTRAQMAVFLLKAKHGADYQPPVAEHSRFRDVPDDYWAKDWIEQLAAEGITSGYPDGTYKPENPVSRAEMSVFLVKAFELP